MLHELFFFSLFGTFPDCRLVVASKTRGPTLVYMLSFLTYTASLLYMDHC